MDVEHAALGYIRIITTTKQCKLLAYNGRINYKTALRTDKNYCYSRCFTSTTFANVVVAAFVADFFFSTDFGVCSEIHTYELELRMCKIVYRYGFEESARVCVYACAQID